VNFRATEIAIMQMSLDRHSLDDAQAAPPISSRDAADDGQRAVLQKCRVSETVFIFLRWDFPPVAPN
jgi:hypothetical protein